MGPFAVVRSSVFRFLSLKSFGGDEEDRTPDPLRARQVLSQLSYTPIHGMASVFCFEVSAELSLNRALKIKQYSQTLQIPVPAIGHRSVRVCLTP